MAALPSPTPTNSSSVSITSTLPQPRSRPLKAGSSKEEIARRYIDTRLLHISRRYVKRLQPSSNDEEVPRYTSITEVCKDITEVVDVIWLTGTPHLQVPYLMDIALAVVSYLPGFPGAPKPTFALLNKLDRAFSSLLKGKDSGTGSPLPGFNLGKNVGFSKTDMVRCKSLFERTRLVAVEVMGKDLEAEQEEGNDESESENGMDVDDPLDMEIGGVYQESIEILGELLASEAENNDLRQAWPGAEMEAITDVGIPLS
ncbi:hypothetical protein B0O99DRAFT_588875 [Bisporella sp. PMI_857]|nr:hypothetical protein B0O99DRAFT_588875 [Bisporella sp. PMI_857]